MLPPRSVAGTDMGKLYDTDMGDAAWALVAPLLPPAKPGGRPRTTCLRAVLNAVFYLLRSGCQWRLLPREYPPWSTVHHYFRLWRRTGVWAVLHRILYRATRAAAGRNPCPSVVIMDAQSVKTTEHGGVRGFDAHKRVKGRKRHILVDTGGLLFDLHGYRITFGASAAMLSASAVLVLLSWRLSKKATVDRLARRSPPAPAALRP
jgi:transposase